MPSASKEASVPSASKYKCAISVMRLLVATQDPSKSFIKNGVSFTNNKNKIESEIPDKIEAEIFARPNPSCTSVVLSPRIQGVSNRCTTIPIIPLRPLLRPYPTG